MMTSFDYQNAFRCDLFVVYKFVSRTSDSSQKKKYTEYNSWPQSILVLVVK